jgi:hypothetical protein
VPLAIYALFQGPELDKRFPWRVHWGRVLGRHLPPCLVRLDSDRVYDAHLYTVDHKRVSGRTRGARGVGGGGERSERRQIGLQGTSGKSEKRRREREEPSSTARGGKGWCECRGCGSQRPPLTLPQHGRSPSPRYLPWISVDTLGRWLSVVAIPDLSRYDALAALTI